MKKYVLMQSIMILICIAAFIFAGCGEEPGDNASKVKQSPDSSSELSDDTVPIGLNEDTDYVLVAKKDKYVIINSEEDFENFAVAYIGGTDGEVYAKYYEFESIGMYNAINDLHSGITGKEFDVGLIEEDKLSTYDDWEVVWEMKR